MEKKIDVYLAGPYTHNDPAVMQWRYDRLNEAAAYILREKMFPTVFSPISYTHPINLCNGDAPTLSYDAWLEFDMTFLDNSTRLVILKIPGWDSSKGVDQEIARAEKLELPIYWAEPAYDAMFRIIAVVLQYRDGGVNNGL